MDVDGRVLAGATIGAFTAGRLAVVFLRNARLAWMAAAVTGGLLAGMLSFRSDHYDIVAATLSTVIGSALLIIAVADMRERRIPNAITYPMLILALGCSGLWPDRQFSATLLGLAVTLAIASALLLGLALRMATSTALLGVGDLKLMVLLGAVLGWPLVLWALVLGATFGGVAAMVALAARQRTMPYGPHLVAGGLVALLWPESSPWT